MLADLCRFGLYRSFIGHVEQQWNEHFAKFPLQTVCVRVVPDATKHAESALDQGFCGRMSDSGRDAGDDNLFHRATKRDIGVPLCLQLNHGRDARVTLNPSPDTYANRLGSQWRPGNAEAGRFAYFIFVANRAVFSHPTRDGSLAEVARVPPREVFRGGRSGSRNPKACGGVITRTPSRRCASRISS